MHQLADLVLKSLIVALHTLDVSINFTTETSCYIACFSIIPHLT